METVKTVLKICGCYINPRLKSWATIDRMSKGKHFNGL